jgi:hypothetical protein
MVPFTCSVIADKRVIGLSSHPRELPSYTLKPRVLMESEGFQSGKYVVGTGTADRTQYVALSKRTLYPGVLTWVPMLTPGLYHPVDTRLKYWRDLSSAYNNMSIIPIRLFLVRDHTSLIGMIVFIKTLNTISRNYFRLYTFIWTYVAIA